MSAFCSGLCNEISRCCYDFYHAPFTKKNLLIGGGVLLGIIILIIIIVVAVGPTYGGLERGSEVLLNHPLVDGANSLSYNMKYFLMDKLNTLSDEKHSLNSNLSLYWSSRQCKRCQTDLMRLSQGLVATQVFSLTTSCDAQYKDSVSQTLEQIDLFKRIISNSSYKIALVKEADDIAKHFDSHMTGAILSVWGGHNIDSRLAVLRMFYDLGVRVMSLVGSDCETNTICYPPWINKDDGLLDFGNKVIDEMNRLGMMIDLTGCSLKVQNSVLSRTKAPVIYSHSGALNLTFSDLNVEDSILSAYKNKMQLGLVMVPFTPSQISSNNHSTMKDVASHLDGLLKHLPSTKIGIGSNFDNMLVTTEKLDDVSTFPRLFDYLWSPPKGEKSFTEQQLKEFASTNFINVFKAVEKESKNLKKSIPDDSIIAKNEIPSQSCYSDFDIRYNTDIPTAPTTTKPTTTTATTSPTTTKKP